MHSFLPMDKLLTIALINNGEGSGEARLRVSEILQLEAQRLVENLSTIPPSLPCLSLIVCNKS